MKKEIKLKVSVNDCACLRAAIRRLIENDLVPDSDKKRLQGIYEQVDNEVPRVFDRAEMLEALKECLREKFLEGLL